ncbi:MAG TPA: ribonuclease P protein component [Longimicrobiaceae bacterium]|nr:ribonuclease P protein component [Longimicrobiaceae bacterium]
MTADGAAGGEGRLRLPRNARITASGDIRSLFRRGKRRKTRHLDVFISTSPVSHARWGIVVPKHRRRIVERNRLKRRIREIVRTVAIPQLRAADAAYDVLFRARPEAYEASFTELLGEISGVTEELCSRER